jgi:hypothetical protein
MLKSSKKLKFHVGVCRIATKKEGRKKKKQSLVKVCRMPTTDRVTFEKNQHSLTRSKVLSARRMNFRVCSSFRKRGNKKGQFEEESK